MFITRIPALRSVRIPLAVHCLGQFLRHCLGLCLGLCLGSPLPAVQGESLVPFVERYTVDRDSLRSFYDIRVSPTRLECETSCNHGEPSSDASRFGGRALQGRQPGLLDHVVCIARRPQDLTRQLPETAGVPECALEPQMRWFLGQDNPPV